MSNGVLMTKFNKETGGAYDYLVLSSVDVEISSELIRINLIYPEDKERQVAENRDDIIAAFRRVLGVKASLEVKLIKSHFDEMFFKAKLLDFFDDYPSVAPYVFVDQLTFVTNADGSVCISLEVDSDVYDTIIARKIPSEIGKLLERSYCEKITLDFKPKKVRKVDLIACAEEELKNRIYRTGDAHMLTPQNVEAFIGKIVYDKAGYICDAKREANGVVYCGNVSEFSECTRKPREGETGEGKKFYKFTLTDPTGQLKCLLFPRKELGNIQNMRNGMSVVVKGALKKNEFRGQVSFDMFVNAISLCTFSDSDFKVSVPRAAVPKDYVCVKPEPYVSPRQTNLFDVAKEPAAFLRGKTFCVFDVETTGTNPREDKLIEIGAVKLVDGKLTEVFSTYVNPGMPIPERITDLTSITDSDVVFAPKIDKVLPDFYKFSNGTILVGQNITFDISFVAAAGAGEGMYFDNSSMDTLSLARKYLPGLHNYKLGTILKSLGINNEHAHRAIHDAVATAQAFMLLCEKIVDEA